MSKPTNIASKVPFKKPIDTLKIGNPSLMTNDSRSEQLPEPTPEWLNKPHLVWVGKVLGCDIYADMRNGTNDKRDVIEKFLKRAVEPTNKGKEV